MARYFAGGLAGLLGLLAALGAWAYLRAPITPAAWEPPAAPPLEGPTAANDLLGNADHLGEGLIPGPEDVAVDAQGRVYGGTSDGRIVRLTPAEGGKWSAETFASTGGRPLGLAMAPDGRLLAAVADVGLVLIDPRGKTRALVQSVDGEAVRVADGLDVSSEGVVYFSDASSRFPLSQYRLDLLEGRPHGRLLRYDLQTGRASLVLPGLYFANGVALSKDGSFVLVSETGRYRVTRYWISGRFAATSDVFLDNLPGFPDGISTAPDGTFWIALAAPRNQDLDRIHRHPHLKRLTSVLPLWMQPRPKPYGLVLQASAEGKILRSLHDPTGRKVPMVTSARQFGGALYLGTLEKSFVARVALEAAH